MNPIYEKMHLNLKNFGNLPNCKWVVTEKIHGANFSFIYQNRQLFFAKRKAFLNGSDDFFGFQRVVHSLEERVLELFEALALELEADAYILYGELFGGAYPHTAVAPCPDVQAIQTGVYYSPNILFCAFDLAWIKNQQKFYLNYQQATLYFEKYNILYAHPLKVGTLNEVLQFNTRIISTLPTLLHLPALSNNWIEGIVIKPWAHNHIKNLEIRPIFKIKNQEFDELPQFHKAAKWSFIPRDVVSLSESLNFIWEDLRSYANLNRLHNAISKTGRLDVQKPQQLASIEKEFIEDVWADFNTDAQILEDLTPTQKDWLWRRLKNYAQWLLTTQR